MRCRKCNGDISTTTGYCPMCGEDLSKVGYDNTPSSPVGQAPVSSAQMPKFTGPSAFSGNSNLTFSSNNSRGPAYGTSRNVPRSEPPRTDSTMTDLSSYYASMPRSYSYDTTPSVPTNYTRSTPPYSAPAPTPAPAKPKKTPLSFVGLLLTALIATGVLIYDLSQISYIGNSLELLYSIPGFDSLMPVLNRFLDSVKTVVLITKLPSIAIVVAMWLIFASLATDDVKPGLFSSGISVLRGFRIFTLVLCYIALAIFALIIFLIGELPDVARGPFTVAYLIGLTGLIMVVVYHTAVLRTLSTIRDGVTRGIYYKASGYVIFCLFASFALSLLTISSAGFYTLLQTGLSLLHGICLCIYNSRRDEFNRLR